MAAVAPVVERVAVPWLIVRSPARVVERLAIVPVVLLSVAIVPLVAICAVDVVVPAVNVGIVPSVMLAVLEVRDRASCDGRAGADCAITSGSSVGQKARQLSVCICPASKRIVKEI